MRKNLMVDPDELRAWAKQRGTSQSEAVRDAVRLAMAAQEMVAALEGHLRRALRPRTHLADVLIVVSAARLIGGILTADRTHFAG